MTRRCLHQIARPAGFIGAGAVAFAVDQGVLQGLTLAGLKPALARLISIFAAILVAWRLNRMVFNARRGSVGWDQAGEFLIYLVSALTARALDYGVFLRILPWLMPALADHVGTQLVLALAAVAGAIAGGLLGYVLFDRLVFRTRGTDARTDRRGS